MFSVALMMWLLDRWLSAARLPDPLGLLTMAGWTLVLCGFSLDVYCLLGFIRQKTTASPLKPGNASLLICDGFYRHSRNPMYLGMAILLTGWSLVLRNPLCLLVLPVFVAYINRFQIAPEERALSARFGDEYLAYTRRVPRWL